MLPVSLASADWLEGMVVSNWVPINHRSLKAEFTLELRNGQVFHACRYFENRTTRWVRAPQRKNEVTGEYENLVEFVTPEMYRIFLREALKAVDLYIKGLHREH